jgi:hypothetical protein
MLNTLYNTKVCVKTGEKWKKKKKKTKEKKKKKEWVSVIVVNVGVLYMMIEDNIVY